MIQNEGLKTQCGIGEAVHAVNNKAVVGTSHISSARCHLADDPLSVVHATFLLYITICLCRGNWWSPCA